MVSSCCCCEGACHQQRQTSFLLCLAANSPRAVQTTLTSSCCCAAAVDALAHGSALKLFPFNRREWNVKGDVLVLDATSLMPHPMFEGECNNACARTPGCNAWVYCDNEAGCGSGCAACTANNPPCAYIVLAAHHSRALE